ncbi:hypothetical protein [Enterobacter sp.]|uniref:hypothetical protein n=1 Tax=Enterobacter sp. TaxID=42895 RepID=UPI00296EABE5|nr:hypothetical protein [Enterobacter sp.]
MKRITQFLLLAALLTTIHPAHAIVIQTGEWFATDTITGKTQNYCYKPKTTAILGNARKGRVVTKKGCVINTIESNETTFKSTFFCLKAEERIDLELDLTKIGKNELTMKMRLAYEKDGKKTVVNRNYVQKFIKKTCSSNTKPAPDGRPNIFN